MVASPSSSPKEEELGTFLKELKKEKFQETLLGISVRSREELAAASVDDLAQAMPKSIARILKRKAQASVDSKKSPTSNNSSKASPELVDLLKETNKEKYLDVLVSKDMHTRRDLALARMDDLAKVMPKSVARVLQKKVQSTIPPLKEPDEGPIYNYSLDTATKQEIREIWRALQTSIDSFGTRYYEMMLCMDKDAMECFPGVNLSSLGKDFDQEVEQFIRELDNVETFQEHRDQFLARLVRYNISVRTLWLGAETFVFAAISLCPELDMTRNMSHWVELYRSIIPPFHPSILKTMPLPCTEEIQSSSSEISELVKRELGRRGYLYYATWLKDHTTFFQSFQKAGMILSEWQKGQGSWAEFETACRDMMADMELPELRLGLLCAAMPDVLGEHMMDDLGVKFENVLLVICGALHGIERLVEGVRNHQKDIVSDTWDLVYRRSSAEFSEVFYSRFTEDPKIAMIFMRTDLAMQRVRFVHQLNVVLLRIGEDVATVLRPLLLELGERHRFHFMVGIKEMVAVITPLLDSVRLMLGTTHWTSNTADAWAYITNVVVRYMVVGWTCGIDGELRKNKAIVIQNEEASRKLSKPPNNSVLLKFREASPELYSHFFRSFAGNVNPKTIKAAATRYQRTVDRILEESDISTTLDRLHALGSRHERHHGVTLKSLSSAAKAWMSTADIVFGRKFTSDVALEWARLWVMIALCMTPDYSKESSCPTVEELFAPYRVNAVDVPGAGTRPPMVTRLAQMTLTKKMELPGSVAYLIFECDTPVKHKAGQYAKVRWTLQNGRNVTRYYSIASCPEPTTGTTRSMELCIKEVPKGKASPFLVNDFSPPSTCDLMLIAGHFVLPDQDEVRRLMCSGGIGLSAFMGVIRSVAGERRSGMLKRKVSLGLIHCERSLPFVLSDELFAIAREYAAEADDLFTFHLTLCFTRACFNDIKLLREQHPYVSIHTDRINQETILNSLKKFPDPPNTEVYLCGPGSFQKAVREHLSHKLGHSRTLIHQEFFEL